MMRRLTLISSIALLGLMLSSATHGEALPRTAEATFVVS
jgi:hypothetical protein